MIYTYKKKCFFLKTVFQFFTFFLNDYYLVSWMKDEWEKDYEQEFVHTTIVAPFQGYAIVIHLKNFPRMLRE